MTARGGRHLKNGGLVLLTGKSAKSEFSASNRGAIAGKTDLLEAGERRLLGPDEAAADS